jgi:hypothetical protein
MNKLIVVLLIASISYCSYESYVSRVEKDKKNNEEILKKAIKEKEINQKLNGLISELKADTSWIDKLGIKKSSTYVDKYYTKDIENAWLIQNPILFIGGIKDIKNHDEYNYSIKIDFTSTSLSIMTLTKTKLSLEVICPKTITDLIIRDFEENYHRIPGFPITVAAVAKINKVDLRTETNTSENYTKEIAIGYGNCVGMQLAPQEADSLKKIFKLEY